MNKSDSERIAAVLESVGYQPASVINGANLIVVNMCSVRQSAVDRVYGLIPKFKQLKINLPAGGPKLKTILTGCILEKDKKKFKKEFDFVLNVKNLANWPKLLGIKKNLPEIGDYLEIKPKRQSNFLAFIPVSNGCNNSCTYCAVPFTRGPLVCRQHKAILKEVKEAVKKGYREIWLLGQNVNDYQSPIDASVNFPKLLRRVNDIPGNFRIRFVSSHPKDFSDELIETIAESEKVAKCLHLPVQSGDDKILEKMRRPYTVSQYENLVRKIRRIIPEINLSTDVIVGFPGETKKQFENTLKLFKKIKFNMAYIAKYSPRPGTAAIQMKDNVPLSEKKKREKILRNLLNKK